MLISTQANRLFMGGCQPIRRLWNKLVNCGRIKTTSLKTPWEQQRCGLLPALLSFHWGWPRAIGLCLGCPMEDEITIALPLISSLCVLYMTTSLCRYLHMCTHICGGQRSILGVFLNHVPFYFLLDLFYFMRIFCLHACMCTMCVPSAYVDRSDEDMGSPGTGVKHGCQPVGCWARNQVLCKSRCHIYSLFSEPQSYKGHAFLDNWET